METSKMKNMIVLKNPPSNLIEEAIIILKSNKKIQELKYIENKLSYQTSNIKEKNYIIKEAECVLSNYISKIETKEKKKLQLKYMKLKKYSICITILLIIAFIKIII